jgi:hypothetical protein
VFLNYPNCPTQADGLSVFSKPEKGVLATASSVGNIFCQLALAGAVSHWNALRDPPSRKRVSETAS